MKATTKLPINDDEKVATSSSTVPSSIKKLLSGDSLKDYYRTFYDRICSLDSGCLNLSVTDILDKVVLYNQTNADDINFKLNQYFQNELNENLWIQDFSGIGLYSLAYKIANDWARGDILRGVDALFVIPITEIINCNNPESFEYLLASSGYNPERIPKKSLVIISGYSKNIIDQNNKNISSILNTIKNSTFPQITIANIAKQVQENCKDEIIVALDQLYLQVENLKGKAKKYQISGEMLLEEGSASLTSKFITQKQPSSISSIEDWHQKIFKFAVGGPAMARATIQVPHIYKPFTVQAFILKILKDKNSLEDIALNDIAKWFSAAITPNTASKIEVACYRVMDFLMLRNLENHYIAPFQDEKAVTVDLSQNESTTIPLTYNFSAEYEGSIKSLLVKLKNDSNFQNLTWDTLHKELQNGTSEYNRVKQSKLSKADKKAYNTISKNIKAQPSIFNSAFSRKKKGTITYNFIQKEINQILVDNANTSDFSMTAYIRDILNKKAKPIKGDHIIALGITATMLSETNRYPLNFLTTLCLLDLIQHETNAENDLWKKFFAHPNHVDNNNNNSMEDSIIRDIALTIGGLMPMSQGNSYYQVSNTEQTKGLNLVQFKTQVILMEWLKLSVSMQKHLNPHLNVRILKIKEENILTLYKDNESFLQLQIAHNKLACANLHIIDRLFRRLENFDKITPTLPVRDLAPWAKDKLLEFATQVDTTSRLELSPVVRIGVAGFNSKMLDNAILMSIIGRLHKAFSVTNVEKRIENLKLILAIDPDFLQIYFLIGDLYFATHKNDNALEYLNHFMERAHEELRLHALYMILHINVQKEEFTDFDQQIQYFIDNLSPAQDTLHYYGFFLRAYVNCIRKLNIETIKSDIDHFVKNVTYKEAPTEYLQAQEIHRFLRDTNQYQDEKVQINENKVQNNFHESPSSHDCLVNHHKPVEKRNSSETNYHGRKDADSKVTYSCAII